MTWHVERTSLGPNLEKAIVRRDGQVATFRQVAEAWRDDAEFADAFSKGLAECSFRGFRWECPPFRRTAIDRPFESILQRSDALDDRHSEPHVFSAYFDDAADAEKTIVGFENDRGDAWLIVPLPASAEANYVHLAAFLRTAPAEQIREMWKEVGKTVFERLTANQSWLSTAGMGVGWLHVRFDERPKYYSHVPYARDRM